MKKKWIFTAALIATLLPISAANSQSFDSVAHIHSVKVLGKKILIGTHEGLFIYQGPNKMQQIGKERFDVMGLTIIGKTIYASGHPGKGSKLPEPVGLLKSTDNGVKWKKVSLQGKVDFHLLHAGAAELYGVDAQTNVLMYSSTNGKAWRQIGINSFSDIAITNQYRGEAYAVENSKLYKSANAFSTMGMIKTPFPINEIEIVGDKLYATSGKSLYMSANKGESWREIFTFQTKISGISSSDELIVTIVGRQIFKSKDGGRGFEEA